MNAQRTHEAARCGAAGVAVMSAITAAPSPEASIAALQTAIAQGRAAEPRPAPLLPQSTLR